MAELAAAAGATGDSAAAQRLYDALLPYRGRLVVSGGAAVCGGFVSYHLGVLARAVGHLDRSVELLEEAATAAEEIGALPLAAQSLAELAQVLTRRAAVDDLEKAVACRRRARGIAEQLGMSVLLRGLAPAGEWSLLREEPDWLLVAGTERARLRDSRGLHYLRSLLAAPGQDIAALDLVAGTGLVASRVGPVIDGTARRAYRRRLDELSALLDAADRAGDPAAASAVHHEREALLTELRRASGLAGRVRDASPEAERARVNVTRTLRTAVARIAAAAPLVGAHLQQSIRTGSYCRYDPAPGGPERWRL